MIRGQRSTSTFKIRLTSHCKSCRVLQRNSQLYRPECSPKAEFKRKQSLIQRCYQASRHNDTSIEELAKKTRCDQKLFNFSQLFSLISDLHRRAQNNPWLKTLSLEQQVDLSAKAELEASSLLLWENNTDREATTHAYSTYTDVPAVPSKLSCGLVSTSDILELAHN